MAIRHPNNASDYSKVGELLNITLNTLLGQSDQNFKVVIVCNKIPPGAIKHDKVHYHVVSFPPLSEQVPNALGVVDKFQDKGTKYLTGLLFAKQFNPKQVFIVDADDWIHKDTVAMARQKAASPVLYVNDGYFVNYDSKEYKRKSGMNRYCGTTFVYDFDFLFNLTSCTDSASAQDDQNLLLSRCDQEFVLRVLSNHKINYRYFRLKGYPPKDLNLRAICWVQGTGENVSRVKPADKGVAVDEKFLSMFTLGPSVTPSHTPITIRTRELLNSIKSSFEWRMTQLFKKQQY